MGKSTLFNCLVGRRRAIVHDLPGVTRDRIVETADLGEGSSVDLIDTGGLLPEREDALGLNEQVLLAVEESDVLIFVVDGKEGPLPGDTEVLETLRRYGKSIVLVVNKADTKAAEVSVNQFYSFGLEPILVSAEHRLGLETLVDRVRELLPESPPSMGELEGPAVAIVGRPNVGKSSLLNRLVGGERALVSEVAGTTRDPVDSVVEWDERTYVLIDTAGIRRRSQVSGVAEGLAVMMARRQIQRAQVVVLVVDASQGVTAGDLAIAGVAWEEGRGVVVVMNKWDLLSPLTREHLEEGWERLSELLAAPARVNISALSGRGVGRIFPKVVQVLDDLDSQVETSRLNTILQRAVASHHIPTGGGKAWKVFYASQVAAAPPTFMLFANRTLPQKSSYRRYLENTLRRELGLPGIPIRLVIRPRDQKKR